MRYTIKEAKEINLPSNGALHAWIRRERIPDRMALNAIYNDKYYRVNARPYNVDLAFLYGDE